MATVRAAVISDAEAIAAVHVDSWRSAYYDTLPHSYLARLSPDALRRRWAARLAAADVATESVLVVEHGGRVAGFAVLGPCRDDEHTAGFAGEVTMLYVHPDRAGAGLGTLLLRRCFELIEERSYRWVVVWVVEDNHDARGFYEHLGLRLDGAVRVDTMDGRDVRVVRHAMPVNPVIELDAFGRVTAR